MSWRVAWFLVPALPGGWSAAAAQVSDSAAAAAVGVYQAPVDSDAPPADTASGDTVPAPDEPAPPTPATVQEVTPLDTAPAAADEDTSLTYRLDARRGGGLSRGEFPDLKTVAAGARGYGVFLQLLADSGAAILAGDSLVTVLAPTDSAFALLPAAELARLRGDERFREAWLKAVIFPGARDSRELLAAGELRSRSGAAVPFRRGEDGWVHAGPARVVQIDLYARNGILHGVDRVILPETTSAAP